MSSGRGHAARLAGALPSRRARTRRPVLGRPRISPRVLAVAVAVVLLLGAAWLLLRDSALVEVRKVEVTGVAGPDARAVTAALERAGRNMTTLHVREAALRSAVASFPLVRRLETDARPPHGLRVHVILERPVAVVTGGGKPEAVTAAGKVLPRVPSSMALPAVPVRTETVGGHVKGARTLGALRALGAAPAALRSRVERMAWTKDHGLTATLRDGPDLYLGPAVRLAAKWLAIARVLADPTSQGARYVDVRVPERPAAGGVAPPPEPAPAPGEEAPADPAGAAATPAVPAPQAAPATPVAPSSTTPPSAQAQPSTGE